MIARVVMGMVLSSSLYVAGSCCVGTSVIESYGSLAATGGAPCYYCREQDYCMSMDVPCTANGNSWYMRTFTGITQRFCKDYEKWGQTGDGQDMCSADTYMACTSITWCSQMDCPMASCGEPSPEEKTTHCDFTGGMACMIGS